MQLRTKYLVLLAALLIALPVSANQWMVACHPASGLLQYQPGIIESNRAWAYGDFATNNGEETQPVLTEAQVGPMRMLLPGYLYSENIKYVDNRAYENVGEGFNAGYVHVSIMYEPWDPASIVGRILENDGIYASPSMVVNTTSSHGLPMAYYDNVNGDRVGACLYNNCTVIVTVDNDRPSRLTAILNSIH